MRKVDAPGADDVSEEEEINETEPNPDQYHPVGSLPTANQVNDGSNYREQKASDLLLDQQENQELGLKNVSAFKMLPKNQIHASLFLEFMFKDKLHIKLMVRKMNQSIKASRDSKTKLFSPDEFIVGLGLIIGALVNHPNFDRYMPFHRFKDFRRFLPSIWVEEGDKDSDPWYAFTSAIKNFNEIRQMKLHKCPWAVIDESMSAWRPRTTKLGGLPNLSNIPRKPEPLGTEFKCTADPRTGCMIAIEIQRGKEGMKNQRYNADVGNTCGCTLRLMDLSRADDGICVGVKGDAWFGSVKNCANWWSSYILEGCIQRYTPYRLWLSVLKENNSILRNE